MLKLFPAMFAIACAMSLVGCAGLDAMAAFDKGDAIAERAKADYCKLDAAGRADLRARLHIPVLIDCPNDHPAAPPT